MSEGAPEGQGGAGDGGGSGSGGDEQDWKAEAEKWKSLARKNETDFKKVEKEIGRLKPLADELEALKRNGQSEAERLTSLQSSLDNLNTEHGTVTQERDSLKVEVARLRAGLAAGLSLEDMQYIPPGDEAEMAKAAKTLAERLGAARTPNFDGGGRGRTPEAPTTFGGVIRELRDRGRGGNAS